MGKQGSVARGAGSSSGQKRNGADDEEDSDPRWLSLCSIYSNAAAAAAAASASPALAGESCTLVTPTLPERPMPQMDVLGTPSAAATRQPPVAAAGNASAPAFAPCFATSVLNGNGNAFLATSVLTPTQLASSLSSLFPGHGHGNGAVSVPIAAHGNAAVQVPIPVPGSGNISPPTQLGPLLMPSPCIRLSTTPLPAKEGAAPRLLNSQPQQQQRSTRRRTGGSSSSSSNGDPPANNGTGPHGSDAPDNGGMLNNPPFPWATSRVAVHHSFTELCNRGITTIEGEIECRRCDARKMISYDIEAKFKEVADFISANIHDMDDHAPTRWTNPTTMPDCGNCSQKQRPIIPTEKQKINWMFLLLSQTLGLCTLEQLKHFYSTYMELSATSSSPTARST